MRRMARRTTPKSAMPRRWRQGAFPVLRLLAAIALVVGGGLLIAACDSTETGTITAYAGSTTNYTDPATGDYWVEVSFSIEVELDSGERVRVSEIADVEVISPADVAGIEGGKRVEVRNKGDSWEFVRLLEE